MIYDLEKIAFSRLALMLDIYAGAHHSPLALFSSFADRNSEQFDFIKQQTHPHSPMRLSQGKNATN
jgi:hypothetical protein